MASKHAPRRPRLRGYDKALLVWMTKLWPNLLGLCQVVQPSTILRWHRTGFRAYWRWPAYVVRDNDGVYGRAFTRRLRSMGIRDRPIALAKSICRTADWHAATRLPGSFADLRRGALATRSELVLILLQRDAHAFLGAAPLGIIVAAGAGRALADRRPLRDKLHRA